MPVEIRELVIRATVIDDESQTQENAPGQGVMPSQAFLQECVRQVLTILNASGER